MLLAAPCSSAFRFVRKRSAGFCGERGFSWFFPIGFVLSDNSPIGFFRNTFWAAHIAVRKSCAGGLIAPHATASHPRPCNISAVARIRKADEPYYVMKSKLFTMHLKRRIGIELNKTEGVAQQSGKKAPPNAVKQQKQALRDGQTLPATCSSPQEATPWPPRHQAH